MLILVQTKENIIIRRYTINNFFQLIVEKKVYGFLGFNKITKFDQIHTFQVKHIPFSINKHQCIFFSWGLNLG